MNRFVATSTQPASRDALAAWHGRPGALERLVAGWSGVKVIRSLTVLENGAQAELSVPLAAGLRKRWVAVHEDVTMPERFVDRSLSGPFAAWRHQHRFDVDPSNATQSSRLTDDIAYTLPFGPLGQLAHGMVKRDLERMFTWRHERTRRDLRRQASVASDTTLTPPRTIAISGASGLVGSALTAFLTTAGHRVVRIVRTKRGDDDIVWDLVRGTIDVEKLRAVDAVVHLAGESIATRWSAAKKDAIRQSRVASTRLLAETMASCVRNQNIGPRILVSASAIGYYGDRSTDEVDERSPRGDGFLASVCEEWERAADPARTAGIRVVHPRIGMVLSAQGGALKQLLLPFSLGAGGPVGHGRQGVSWISLDDLVGVLFTALSSPAYEGPINAVAPGAVSSREFARTLGRVLHRPAFAPLPAMVVKALFGEMGRELLLAGAFVRPSRLLSLGFAWSDPDLEQALRFELGRLAPTNDVRFSA